MEARDRQRTIGIELRIFDVCLKALSLALVVASVAAVPLLALFMTGRGPITVRAELPPPYRISFLDEHDRSIVVASNARINEYRNFDVGQEARFVKDPPKVRLDVRVDPNDTDTRAVISGAAVAVLVLAWGAVGNLHRIVHTAVDGDPFTPRNVTRLRWLGVAVVAWPVVNLVAIALLDRTLDTGPPVDVARPAWGSWALIIVGLGVFALAEVFKQGAELRQFEMETV